MQIHGLNKTTLLDYPEHLAATIFTGGCNFRCVFCQNESLVRNPDSQPVISEEEIFAFLRKRRNILQGVCISGGEPTLNSDLSDFIRKIKELGLLVKLDTNGYRPDMIKSLYENKLIDMVAMDIKSTPADYADITGIANLDITPILESVEYLKKCGISYEFRTTIVDGYFTDESITEIGKWLKGCHAYYLQCFQDSDNVLTPGLQSPSKETLLKYREILLSYCEKVELRGVE